MKLERNEVIEKIKKLLNMTEERGASPSEAASAAEIAQAMLLRHGLSMMDVEEHTGKNEFQAGKETHESYYKVLPGWTIHLANLIAEAYDCEIVLTRPAKRTKRKAKVHFIGEEFDAIVASYLYARLEVDFYNGGTKEAKEEGYRGKEVEEYRANYCTAAGEVVYSRLMTKKNEAKAQNSQVGALIVRKKELVERAKYNFFPNLKKGSSYRIGAGIGTHAGREAGERADLDLNRVTKDSNGREIKIKQNGPNRLN